MDLIKQEHAYDIAIDSDRVTIAQVVLALVFCVAFIILEARHLVMNQVTRPSLTAVLVTVCCFALAIRFRDILLKLALVLIGVQDLTRFILAQVQAPYPLKHLAAIGGGVLKIIGLLMIIFAIGKWLRSVIRRAPILKPEEPTP
jgi:hypothetical protein